MVQAKKRIVGPADRRKQELKKKMYEKLRQQKKTYLPGTGVSITSNPNVRGKIGVDELSQSIARANFKAKSNYLKAKYPGWSK